jgi:hypothetical protein
MRYLAHRPALVTALALALCTTGAPSALAQEPPGVVVRGVVLDPAGRALAGAAVTITALRPMNHPEDVQPGDTYSDAPLAEAMTRSDGTFALPLNGTYPELVSYGAVNGGIVNFWIATRKFTDLLGPATNVETPTNGTVYSAADMVYLAVDSTGALDIATGETGEAIGLVDVVELETMADATVNGATSGSVSDQECGPYGMGEWTVESRDVFWEPIGQIHTGWDTTLRIDYGDHANTDLSGGIKMGTGPWKMTSSYSHMGNEAEKIGANYPDYMGVSVLTKFRYLKERFDYRNSANAAPCYQEWRVRPLGWHRHSLMDGMDRSAESSWNGVLQADKNNSLGEWKANSDWTKKTGRGRKMTTEVSAFGVSLSAQSTWSSQIDVFYKFGAGTKRLHYLYHPTKQLEDAPAIYAW